MVTLENGWVLRQRQEECHDKMIAAFNAAKEEFLIAANCRFGKTITTLQSLKDYANGGDQLVMVISTMDVKNEWLGAAKKVGYKTDLLNMEINDIDFANLEETGTHIIYVSTQKLGNESYQSEALIKWFNQHEGKKTLVYDECHLGSGTDRTKAVLERLDFDNKVYLSGTPYRKHLKKEFSMDKLEGEDKIFLYTLTDERKDYTDGVITDYVPVQLIMQVLDYSEKIDEITDENEKDVIKYGVSSAYFKKIFSSDEYRDYAIEFLNKIIAFAEEKNVKTFLFYVPLRKVGDDIVDNFEKLYLDKIEFRNLCGDYTTDDRTESEDELQATSEAEKLCAFFKEPSDKIKVAITCNKCGTGATLKGLDVVAFLKDTLDAIPFIQKSQRVRTPEEGKTVGYCLCFNQWQGLKAFCDFAKTSDNKKPDDKKPRGEKEAVNDLIQNGAIKLILDMTEVEDYSAIIDIMSTYEPGKYPLFDDFDFDAWDKDTFLFLTTIQAYKDNLLKKNPKLRKDPGILNAKTPEELAKRLLELGMEKEAKAVPVACTEERMRELLEQYYVDIIRLFYEFGLDRDEVADVSLYDDMLWSIVTTNFGTKEVWTYILRTYPRYVNMIYNYLEKQI